MLNKIKDRKQEGFTIIEVLIVLAIAGLIMLIVFLAVPALQRSQRNNARQADASSIATSISDCLANKNGKVTSCDTFGELTTAQTFDTTKIKQLTNQVATTGVLTGAQSLPAESVQIGTGYKCDDNGQATTTGASSRQFVITYEVESSSSSNSQIRCLDI